MEGLFSEHGICCLTMELRANEMAQQVKTVAIKSDNQSSVAGTYIVKIDILPT